MADEIVAGCKVRNGARPTLVASNEFGDAPAAGRLRVQKDVLAVAREARLVNLEPAGAAAVARRKVAGTLVHPDHDGSLRVRPLGPYGLYAISGLDGCRELGRSATVATDFGVSSR